MSTIKTVENDASVTAFIAGVADPVRRADAETLLPLFARVTGEGPKMWGPSIIGYGKYHYKSERSRQEGDWMLTGFSPRKGSLSLYVLSEAAGQDALLKKLGKHKTGVGCLYINQLADVDMAVLEQLVAESYANMKRRHG